MRGPSPWEVAVRWYPASTVGQGEAGPWEAGPAGCERVADDAPATHRSGGLEAVAGTAAGDGRVPVVERPVRVRLVQPVVELVELRQTEAVAGRPPVHLEAEDGRARISRLGAGCRDDPLERDEAVAAVRGGLVDEGLGLRRDGLAVDERALDEVLAHRADLPGVAGQVLGALVERRV